MVWKVYIGNGPWDKYNIFVSINLIWFWHYSFWYSLKINTSLNKVAASFLMLTLARSYLLEVFWCLVSPAIMFNTSIKNRIASSQKGLLIGELFLEVLFGFSNELALNISFKYWAFTVTKFKEFRCTHSTVLYCIIDFYWTFHILISRVKEKKEKVIWVIY